MYHDDFKIIRVFANVLLRRGGGDLLHTKSQCATATESAQQAKSSHTY